VTDGQQGNNQFPCACRCKDPPGNARSVLKVLQPVIHETPGDRHGNHQGDQDQAIHCETEKYSIQLRDLYSTI
jgi:hypothetical protein